MQNLWKEYSGQISLCDLSFQVKPLWMHVTKSPPWAVIYLGANEMPSAWKCEQLLCYMMDVVYIFCILSRHLGKWNEKNLFLGILNDINLRQFRNTKFIYQYLVCPLAASTHAIHLWCIELIKIWMWCWGILCHSSWAAVTKSWWVLGEGLRQDMASIRIRWLQRCPMGDKSAGA